MDDKNQCGLAPLATGPEDPMIDACKFHDACYVVNKHNGERIRNWCESKFAEKMENVVQSKHAPFWKRQKLRLQARAYYLLARAVGLIPWYFWRGKK
jgi:hypothetical protein